MKVTGLVRVGRNVRDLDSAVVFYREALGFQPVGTAVDDALLADVLGVERVRWLRMRVGAMEIELSECFPAGAAYPASLRANDLVFQHIAIVTTDITAASGRVLRVGAEAISSFGPVHLPVSAGDVSAFKFRDPEGHPLEFLQFPDGAGRLEAGFDHSAICVSNVEESVGFYGELGLVLGSRQVNQGREQDALDGLAGVSVDVVALLPARPTPHVELLGYRAPLAGAAAGYAPGDICADRLIFGAAEGGVRMRRDPDGHVILIDGRG